jgi:hypothetical protein
MGTDRSVQAEVFWGMQRGRTALSTQKFYGRFKHGRWGQSSPSPLPRA